MDITSALFPSMKLESLPVSTPRPPSSESNLTKQELPDMPNTHTVDILPPAFSNSIDGLRSLSTALSVFLRRYDELNDHINFIKTSIDSKLPNHLLTTARPNQSTQITLGETSYAHIITPVTEMAVPERNPNGTATNYEGSPGTSSNYEETDVSQKPEKADILEKPIKTDISKKPLETDISKKPEETDTSKEPEENDTSKKPEETDVSKKPAVSELENICQRMCGREIKRYVVTHISDLNKLRQEIPKALKLAKDPAKLVLESIGRFFLQGSKAYSKGSREIVGRLASVVILECFVAMSGDGIDIAKEEEEYAAKAAIDWRKRVVNEGGLAKADEADARGLLLLISGFGIPGHVFKNEDIRNLMRASNVKGISIALRRSIILIPKVPEVVDWMVKNNLEIEAADIAYTFGLEDKCHPRTILTTFLRNKIKDRQHGSSAHVKEAIKKQLSDLKSIRKCLEAHKVDPSKFLPECNISEKIRCLEKERNELELKAAEEMATQKRKAKEAESSRKPKQQKANHSRLSSHDKSSYNGSTQLSSNYFDGKLPSDYISVYSTSSALHASELPENIRSVAIENGGGLAGGGMLAGSSGHSFYGGTVADQMVNASNGRPYGYHEDSALIEKYLGQAYSRNVQTYDPQPSTAGLIGLYSRPSGQSSREAFPGLPNSDPPVTFLTRGRPTTDLYSFADTVVENESYRGSHPAGSGTMRSSYLY